MEFTWDEKKNRQNWVKHKVSFEEAVGAFFDATGLLIPDPEHSSLEEERFLLLGFSQKNRLLVVCHCYRENDSVIRLISARKASSHERAQYRERWR